MDRAAAQKHLARLIALCDAAGIAGAAFEKHTLSDDEKRLLRRCADTGLFRVRGADNFPSLWLEIKEGEGDWHSFGKNKLSKAVIVLSTFEKLCHRGYVQYSGEAEFTLTGEGFREKKRLSTWQERKKRWEEDLKVIAMTLVIVILLLMFAAVLYGVIRSFS